MSKNKIKMLARNNAAYVYPNSTCNIQNEQTTRIKTEPCDFTYCGLVSQGKKDWTKTSAMNYYRDKNTNNLTMLPKERHSESDASQNAIEISNIQDPEKDHSSVSELDFLVQRAEREFVSIDRKDSLYWSKRLKNNDSARRSRMKRRSNEKDIIDKLRSLQKENIELKYELASLNRHFAKQMDGTKISESPDGECVNRTYENVSPVFTNSSMSNDESPSSAWNSPSDVSFRKTANDIIQSREYINKEHNTYQEATMAAEISKNSQSHVQERDSNAILHSSSNVADKELYFKISPDAEHVDYHNNSCENKDTFVASDNQQVMETEPTSSPVIVNVFSLRNNFGDRNSCNDSLDSKFGIQSVPHKYRHKRGFHSAFSVQS